MFEGKNFTPLNDDDFTYAAQTIGCEPAAIKAVSKVESGHSGFTDGKPTILFESHEFHKETSGKYDDDHPGISTSTWVHNYGPAGQHQYDRLAEAMQLDREAALKSASWGKFQVMGMNFESAGYDNVDAFVADMCESEAYQLDAFVAFCQNDGIDRFLIEKNWSGFALHYNGPGQVDAYAEKIKAAYDELR